MAAGKNAVKIGAGLEYNVISVLQNYGFDAISWSEFNKRSDKGLPLRRVLVKGYRYVGLNGMPKAELDWAIIVNSRVIAGLEVKAQTVGGSTSRKMCYAALDARHSSIPGIPMVVVGGAMQAEMKQKNGDFKAEYYDFTFASEILRNGYALCREVDGLWEPIKPVKKALYLDRDQFESWAKQRFHSPHKMTAA